MTIRPCRGLLFSVILAAGSLSAQAPPDEQIAQLQAKLEAQQAQIDQLRTALEEQKKLLESFSTHRAPSPGEVTSTTPIIPATKTAPALLPPIAIGGQKPAAETKPSPLFFAIGDAKFTPLGFMDFTEYFRSTDVGSGIGTSFGAAPFKNTPAGNLSENRFSAQNSRIGLRVDSTVHGAAVLGYLESDFLGFAPTNIAVTSHANTLRMRLYWVDIKKGPWEVLAGQSWSMMTPNRKGLSALPSDLFYSQNMDTNYQAGLTWSRDPQFRLIYNPNKNVSWGISFEAAEQYIGGAVTLPASLATAYATQLNNGGTTLSVPNLHPDLVSKIAFDGAPNGHAMHFEIAGLYRSFRTYNPTTGQRFTTPAGGGSANFNFELAKGFRLIANTFYSDGGGRYIFGLGPDLMIRADGSISPVHAASTVDGFEWTANSKTLVYGYYGGAYYGRNYSLDLPDKNGQKAAIGFGYPGSPAGANRSIQQGTGGIIQTFWKSPSYGALSLITQYSYVTRSPWSVTPPAPSNANFHMVYANLRYTLP